MAGKVLHLKKFKPLIERLEAHVRTAEESLDAGDCLEAYDALLAGEYASGQLDGKKKTPAQRDEHRNAAADLALTQELFIQKCMRQYAPAHMELVEERRPYDVSRVTDSNPNLFPIKPNDFINGLKKMY